LEHKLTSLTCSAAKVPQQKTMGTMLCFLKSLTAAIRL
jgi:hypothetical protein